MRWSRLTRRERLVIWISVATVVPAVLWTRARPWLDTRVVALQQALADERSAIVRLRDATLLASSSPLDTAVASALADSLRRSGIQPLAHRVSATMREVAALADAFELSIADMRADATSQRKGERCAGEACESAATLAVTVRGDTEQIVGFLRNVEAGALRDTRLTLCVLEVVDVMGQGVLRSRLELRVVHYALRRNAPT
jgi:hypothetical protein